MRILLALFAFVSSGCLRQTEFQCSADTACGAGGTCESTGFCSFADPGCSSGRRYSDSAGSLGGQCTGGGGGGSDGGVDTMGGGNDATVDGPSAGCPAGYNPVTGAPGHLYKLVPSANWNSQVTACSVTSPSAYLAVPDDAAELAALDGLAAVPSYWVGISDSQTEGTWRNVLGQVQTFLPWQPPAPDNNSGGQGEDCVESLTATHTFNDRRCNESLPAICECNP